MSDDLCGVFVTDVHDLRYNYEAPNTRNIKKKKTRKNCSTTFVTPKHFSTVVSTFKTEQTFNQEVLRCRSHSLDDKQITEEMRCYALLLPSIRHEIIHL